MFLIHYLILTAAHINVRYLIQLHCKRKKSIKVTGKTRVKQTGIWSLSMIRR